MQPAVVCFVLECGNGLLLHGACEARHALGQFLRRADGERGVLEKTVQQIRDLLLGVEERFDFALTGDFSDAHDAASLAVGKPAEFEVIGENPVWEFGVADELFAVRPFAALHLGEVGADVFCFYAPERDFSAGDLEIGRADDGNVFGFVGRRYFFAAGFQQILERGPVRLFRGVAVR